MKATAYFLGVLGSLGDLGTLGTPDVLGDLGVPANNLLRLKIEKFHLLL